LLTLSGVSYKVHLGPDPVPSARGLAAGATEMLPIVDGEMSSSSTLGDSSDDPPSKSDVRFLSDSDLLIPD
jgi:hypothetical protein